MTDLICTPPAPASPEGAVIRADGWWPNIDCAVLREELRLGGTTLTHERLVASARFALAEVMADLEDWRQEKEHEGFTGLHLIEPNRRIDDDPRLIVLFLRAVASATAADLADRNLDLTATRDGTDRALTRQQAADSYRRDYVRAVRMIQGTTGVMADLV